MGRVYFQNRGVTHSWLPWMVAFLTRGNGVDISAAVKSRQTLANTRFFPPGWKPGSTAGKDARRYRGTIRLY